MHLQDEEITSVVESQCCSKAAETSTSCGRQACSYKSLSSPELQLNLHRDRPKRAGVLYVFRYSVRALGAERRPSLIMKSPKSPMAIHVLALVLPFLIQGSIAQNCGVGVSGIVSSSQFNELFPRKNPFYTYNDFVTAANSYSSFGTAGTCDTRKREIAAFFAQITQETSGLYYINEINQNAAYCEPSALYPCASGKKYFGRGPMQLSWNYNYKQFGNSIGRDLVNNPELLATDAVISFRSAIWFWMTAQSPKPSCHDVMTGGWEPSAPDRANGRTATFGMTTLIINGNKECGPAAESPGANTSRMTHYSAICRTFGVSPGSGTTCASMTPYS